MRPLDEKAALKYAFEQRQYLLLMAERRGDSLALYILKTAVYFTYGLRRQPDSLDSGWLSIFTVCD